MLVLDIPLRAEGYKMRQSEQKSHQNWGSFGQSNTASPVHNTVWYLLLRSTIYIQTVISSQTHYGIYPQASRQHNRQSVVPVHKDTDCLYSYFFILFFLTTDYSSRGAERQQRCGNRIFTLTDWLSVQFREPFSTVFDNPVDSR